MSNEPQIPLPNDSILPYGEWGWWWRMAYGGSVLVPYYGLTGQALRHLGEVSGGGPAWHLTQLIPASLSVAGGLCLLDQRKRLRRSLVKKSVSTPGPKKITICGMDFLDWHLYHNVLIMGGIGAGKTSGALDWATDQLFQVHSDPGDELGAFVLDVKGNRTTRILKFAHDAGRDVIRNCKIIRPNCALPYVKLYEEATKRMFYVAAVGYSTGSESGRLLAGLTHPDTGEVLPADMFSWRYDQIVRQEPMLKKLTFDLTNRDIRFIGWRRVGDELLRVNRTTGPRMATEYRQENGKIVKVPYPRQLKYAGMGYIDNGLHWNVVNNNIEASEAARRLRLVAQLLNQGKTGGDNKFWDDGAELHVVNCIEFLKIVNDFDAQVDGPDIARLTTQKTFFSEKVKIMNARIEDLKKSLLNPENSEVESELKSRLKKHTDVLSYFQEEWLVMEGKTKTIMQSVVKQLFSQFLLDDKLQRSFCSPSTYSFSTMMSHGDIYIFGGCEYEVLAKFLGTALKIDMQSTVLERPKKKHLNQTRAILFENDECQEFAVAGTGSGVGDDRTMSLARESRLINMLVTQTEAQLATVLGEEGARTYVGACGGLISFQISDPKTAEDLSKRMPEILREKRRLSGNDVRLSHIVEEAERVREMVDWNREPRFTASDFMMLNLAQWETIAFNKAWDGDLAKVCRQANPPHPIGSPKGKADQEEFMRWYECASMEDLGWQKDKGAIFDPVPGQRAQQEASQAAQTAKTASTKSTFVPQILKTDTILAKLDSKIVDKLKTPPNPPDPKTDPAPESSGSGILDSAPQSKEESTPLPPKAETPPPVKPGVPIDPDSVTPEDIQRVRELYRDPAVVAEYARRLTANLNLDLQSNYSEFIEKKANAGDARTQSPEVGPHGKEVGNEAAIGVAPAPAPNPAADEKRRVELSDRLNELEERQSKITGKDNPIELSDQTLNELAEDKGEDDLFNQFKE